MDFSAVIVAAGSGTRAGPGAPKAWRNLAGRPVLRWSLEAFSAAGARRIALVVAADRMSQAEGETADLPGVICVEGGAARAASVQRGLAALDGPLEEPVLIHDAARPFVTRAHVEALLSALDRAEGAVPALPVADTLKRGEDVSVGTVDRAGLWRAQTPRPFAAALSWTPTPPGRPAKSRRTTPR